MSAWRFPHSDHLSPSQVTEYLSCPLCYRFSRIDRVPKPMNVALPVGGAVHKAVEAMRQAHIADNLLYADETRLVDVAAEHFAKSLEVDNETGGEVMLDLGDYKDIGAAKDHTVKLTKYVLPEIAKLDAKRGLIAAELDLRDFENTNPWPFPMHGRIDALYGPDPEHCDSGSDLKTSKRQDYPLRPTWLQIGIYRQFLPVPWFVDVLAKTIKPSFRTYTRSEVMDELVRSEVMRVATAICNGDFPINWDSYMHKFDHWGGPTFTLAVSGFDSAA